MSTSSGAAPGKTRDGNQTLARGLRVLLAVADSRKGLTVHQVGELLGVHRSIAYRLLQTLVDFGLAARSREGTYIPGARLASLSEAYLPTLRAAAAPVMRNLADRLQATVSLFVEQGDEAAAISLVEPTTAPHHIAFRPGMRTPLVRGAAGYAILASGPPVPGEPLSVSEARERGFGRSFGEVESGAFGIAASIPVDVHKPRSALNLITFNPDVADSAGPDLRRAAELVGDLLRELG